MMSAYGLRLLGIEDTVIEAVVFDPSRTPIDGLGPSGGPAAGSVWEVSAGLAGL